MTRDMIFSETELNNNPLLRKMRDRFTCSGNMTIGEIMLHRAERDSHHTSTTDAYMTVPAEAEVSAHHDEPVRTLESPMRSGRRALILSCTAIAVCAVVLLVFIIPVFTNFNANAAGSNETAPNAEIVNVAPEMPVTEVEKPVETQVETNTSSSFQNVMDAFSYAFGA